MDIFDFKEVVNLCYVFAISVLLLTYLKISFKIQLLFLVHLVFVYLCNGLIFEPTYMPDQFKYLKVSQILRDIGEYNTSVRNVYWSSMFFAWFPIPYINSIYSIVLINFLLYLGLFIFLNKKNFFNNKLSLYFYLMYPSMVLYSSVALRDFLVFVIFFLSIYYFVQSKYIKSFVLILILKYIKMQLFYIFILSIVIVHFKKICKFCLSIFKKFHFLLYILMLIPAIDLKIFYFINAIRLSMYSEEFKQGSLGFIYLDYFNFIPEGLKASPSILFAPYPWEFTKSFHYIQFVENICIFGILIYIIYCFFKEKLLNQQTMFLMILLGLFIFIHALVLFNAGTIVRYKFPIMATFIMISFYLLHCPKKDSKCVE